MLPAPRSRAAQRHKVLSSAVTKGAVTASSTVDRIVDAARSADPDNFWQGYEFRLLNAEGQCVADSWVNRFDRATGELELASSLSIAPTAEHAYELSGGEEAPVLAIRYLLGLRLDEPIPRSVVRLGTTRGTNALLTRTGARTAFITTRGFADILRIGYQNRPRLFDLAIRKPEPLFSEVVEIDERVAADGEVLQAPDEAAIRESLTQLAAKGIESLAICLLNASCRSKHEELVGRIAERTWLRAR